MRNLLLSLLLVPTLAWPASATFTYDKTIPCGDRTTIIADLRGNKYSETPLWLGRDANDDSEYLMMVNHRTGHWSILQMNATVACVLGVGTNIKIMMDNLGDPT